MDRNVQGVTVDAPPYCGSYKKTGERLQELEQTLSEEHKALLQSLNHDQKQAILTFIAHIREGKETQGPENPIMIQGPPGTGKTHMLSVITDAAAVCICVCCCDVSLSCAIPCICVHYCMQVLVRILLDLGYKTLVTGHSNAAVTRRL